MIELDKKYRIVKEYGALSEKLKLALASMRPFFQQKKGLSRTKRKAPSRLLCLQTNN